MSERITEAELREMEPTAFDGPLTQAAQGRLVTEVRRLRALIIAADAYLRDNEGDDVILEEAKLIREESRT